MAAHRRKSLSFIFTLLAILIVVWVSAPATTASSISVAPFPPLNDLFHVYGDLVADPLPSPRVWTGGDSTFSVLLPDGRTVWIFSDTFLSPNGPCSLESRPCHNRTLFVAPIVNNTFVIQEEQGLTSTLYREPAPGSPDPPGALIKPLFPNDTRSFYWMGDGIVESNGVEVEKLHVFVHRYPVTCCGVISPSAEATDVATFSLPSLTLDGISEGVSPTGEVRPWAFAAPPVGSVAPVTWGAAILEDVEHVYIYGTEEYPLHKFLHVARAPVGELLTSGWEYYTGVPEAEWSKDPLSSSRILDNVAGELSVVKTTTGYRVVASLLGIGDIMAYEGPTQHGPWDEPLGRRLIVYPLEDVPEAIDGGTVYNAKEHPQLSCSGKSVISYNVNGTVEGKDAFADIHVYRPRFIEVSGLTPVACLNRPPVALDDQAVIKMNTFARVSVLENDTDPDGHSLSVVAVGKPANGRAVVNADQTVTYEPRRGFKGTDSFTYVVGDGHGGEDTAIVTIDVVLPGPIR